MKEISKQLYEFLQTIPELTAQVGNRIYPIIAKENVQFPFVTYTLGEVPYVSKDAREFPINVSVYFQGDKVTTAMDLADILKEKFDDSNFQFNSSEINSDYETGTVYIEINLTKIK